MVGRKVLFVLRVTKVVGRERMDEAEEEEVSLAGVSWGRFSGWEWWWVLWWDCRSWVSQLARNAPADAAAGWSFSVVSGAV